MSLKTPSVYPLSRYSFLRVATVTPEHRVADVTGNTAEILDAYRIARSNGAQVVVFPELCLTGYTCADLFYQTTLTNAVDDALLEIKEQTLDGGCCIVGAPIRCDGQLYNCAVVIASGEICGIIPKTYLPTYNEFYEMRWFASASDAQTVFYSLKESKVPFSSKLLFDIEIDGEEWRTYTFGVEICEDLWAVKPPSIDMVLSGAQCIVNISASPELIGKSSYRRTLVQSQSARCMCAYIYTSAGSGESTTDVVFGGHNLVVENGTILCESQRFSFATTITYADIDCERIDNERIRNSTFRSERSSTEFVRIPIALTDFETDVMYRTLSPTPFIQTSEDLRAERCQEILTIQATALQKRLRHISCSNVVIGLSGGLDSTLALLVCIKAFDAMKLDRRGIHAITMPGFGTSNRTKNNADILAEITGISYQTISILDATRQHFRDIHHDENILDITFENAQARERTQILMDYSNKVGGIVIGTGDMSELALGWCTYNGDHMSMYAVNVGVPKTLVQYLVEWCAKTMFTDKAQVALLDICTTPISPELLPLNDDGTIDQETEKTVGPYILHDFFLYSLLRLQYQPSKILFLAEIAFEGTYSQSTIHNWLVIFLKRFFSQQFKRSCLPDGPKIGSVALSPRGDWRMPSDAIVRQWLDDIS